MLDHVIGNPVLPTVCATSWMASTCERLYPTYRYYCTDNYRLFKGLVFDGTEPNAVQLALKPIQVDNERAQINASIYSINPKGMRVNHYAADITLLKTLPPQPVYEHFDQVNSRKNLVESPYDNGTLFHGPLFQGLKQVLNYSDSKLTMLCRVEDVEPSLQGQFTVGTTNPYVDDLLYQSMLVWVRYQYAAGSLPSSTKCIQQYRMVPAGETFYLSLDVVASSNTKLTADIVLHDEKGRVYTKASGAEVTISEQLNQLFMRA